MKKSEKSKVALVTGGGRRLGRRIVLSLAVAGYDVVINYNSSASAARETVGEVESMGRRAIALKTDISRKRSVEGMIKKSIKTFGRMDLLVNSAAIFVDSPLEKTTERGWDRTLDTNLKGAFLCAQAVAPIMQRQGGGKIINIASLGGIQAWKDHVPYSVSKAGVVMLTRILAKSLAPSIQVNSIAPGTIIMEGEEDPGIKHVSLNRIPLGRYGHASDVTSLVVYLATQAQYITGQTFIVDGGRTLNN